MFQNNITVFWPLSNKENLKTITRPLYEEVETDCSVVRQSGRNTGVSEIYEKGTETEMERSNRKTWGKIKKVQETEAGVDITSIYLYGSITNTQ